MEARRKGFIAKSEKQLLDGGERKRTQRPGPSGGLGQHHCITAQES